jgi:hypothetical protein
MWRDTKFREYCFTKYGLPWDIDPIDFYSLYFDAQNVTETNRYMKEKHSEIAATPQIRVEEADCLICVSLK